MKYRSFNDIEFRRVEDNERVLEFVASDGSVDSYNTVLPVDKWDLSRFQKNGIIGYQHNLSFTGDPDDVIGKGVAYVENNQLIVRIEFEPAEINEKAEKVLRKIQFGSIKSVSVGFYAESGHWGVADRGEREDVFYYDGMQLLEVSVVNIPANENAVKRMMADERAALPTRCFNKGEPGDPAPPAPIQENSAEAIGEDDICLTLAEAMMALAE